jgi:hypothetical protein
MAIEIVDFPIKNGGSFHSYVSLPEGKWLIIINPHLQCATSFMRMARHSMAVCWAMFPKPMKPTRLPRKQFMGKPGAKNGRLHWRYVDIINAREIYMYMYMTYI